MYPMYTAGMLLALGWILIKKRGKFMMVVLLAAWIGVVYAVYNYGKGLM